MHQKSTQENESRNVRRLALRLSNRDVLKYYAFKLGDINRSSTIKGKRGEAIRRWLDAWQTLIVNNVIHKSELVPTCVIGVEDKFFG